MKKTLGAAVLILTAAFVLVHFWKQDNSEVSKESVVQESDARARLTRFWQHYHEATRLRVAGDFDAAATSYRDALQLNPRHEESLYYLANCLIETGDYHPAAEVYRRLIEVNPLSRRGVLQLAALLTSRLPGAPTDFDAARELLQRSVEVNPEESGAFLRLGLLELALGQLEDAARDFRTAAGFRSPEGLFMTGFVRFRQGRLGEAQELFSQVIEIERREREISRRGATAEGDLDASAPAPDNPLHSAVLRSEMHLRWRRPDSRTNSTDAKRMAVKPTLETTVGGAWADFDGDGDLDLLAVFRDSVVLLENRNGRLTALPRAIPAAPPRSSFRAARWGDYDGDADPDLLLFGDRTVHLYRNEGGRFTDVTSEVGPQGPFDAWGASFFDADNDRQTELLVVGASTDSQWGVRFFKMRGQRYAEVAQEFGLQVPGTAVDAAAEDFDGDGFTDLFLLRWKRPAILFRNDGRGGFTDDTQAAGLSDVGGDGYSCIALDYDRDGDRDLLVSSQAPEAWAAWSRLYPEKPCPGYRPRLFRNDDGKFVEVGAELGLNRCYGTLEAAAADVDADGWPDLILANGGYNGERLELSVVLRNAEGSGFEEKRLLPGPHNPASAFSVAAADVDGDGPLEIFLAGSGLYKP